MTQDKTSTKGLNYRLSDISMVSVKHASESVTERTISRPTLYAAWQVITAWHKTHVAESKKKSQKYDVLIYLEHEGQLNVKIIPMTWPSYNDLGGLEFLSYLEFAEYVSHYVQIDIPFHRDAVVTCIDNEYTVYRSGSQNRIFHTNRLDLARSFRYIKNRVMVDELLIFGNWDYSYLDDSDNAFYASMEKTKLSKFLWTQLMLEDSLDRFLIDILDDFITMHPDVVNLSDNVGLWGRVSIKLNNQVANNPSTDALIQLLTKIHNITLSTSERKVISSILGTYHDNLTAALRSSKKALRELKVLDSINVT